MPTNDTQYTQKELIEQLRRLATELDRSPTVADLKQATGYPPASRYLEAFGSWNQAKEAAELETFTKAGRGKTYTKAELLDLLRELARHTDSPVTKRDVNASDKCPSAVTYQRHFGTWNNAKKAAGLATIEAYATPEQYTDEELCAMLRTLAAELDRPLTIRDLEHAQEYPDHSTYERRFGSWNAAKQAAGLTPLTKGQGERGNTYSDADLLDRLRDRAAEVEGQLTKAEMDRADGYPASSTYTRRFGSWQKAKQAARLESDNKKAD